MNPENYASWLLLVVTLIWGLTFPLIKDALHSVSPFLFVTMRLALSAFILIPFIMPKLKKCPRSLVVGAILLGLLNGATYITQSIGLKTISSSHSAFITALYVVFVPFLAALFNISRLKWVHVIAVTITIAGIFILTGARFSGFTIGDGWTVLCAICYAGYVILLQYVTREKIDTWALVFLQIIFGLPLSSGLAFLSPLTIKFNVIFWVALIFCSAFGTVLTFYLQSKYQRYVPVTKAALIYAFEPVFATIFAFLLNKEMITGKMIIGGLLVLVGVLVMEYLPRWFNK